MFVRRTTYNKLIKERDDALDLSGRTLEANSRLLDENNEILELSKSVNKDNKKLLAELERTKKINKELYDLTVILTNENIELREQIQKGEDDGR